MAGSRKDKAAATGTAGEKGKARGLPRLLAPDSWRGRSVEERDRALQSACRGALQQLEGAADRDLRLATVDPVPSSTRAHLRRLVRRRSQHG